MHYLKLRRSRVILGSFFLFSFLIAAFPSVDIHVSRLFFHGQSFQRDPWQAVVHEGLGYFLWISLSIVIATYACNRLLKRNVCSIDGRRVLYLLCVLGVGAGLIVNAGLKDNFGRARPRDVAEFGGKLQFTPAYVVSRECNTNCSFSSGDAAGGFFSLALAMALSRRRAILAAAVALGALVSIARIASGAHFFSDTAVSFFVMLIVADVLYFYILLSEGEREKVSLIGSALQPSYVAIAAEANADVAPNEPRRP